MMFRYVLSALIHTLEANFAGCFLQRWKHQWFNYAMDVIDISKYDRSASGSKMDTNKLKFLQRNYSAEILIPIGISGQFVAKIQHA